MPQLTPRTEQVLRIVARRDNTTKASIASELGVAPQTAAVYLQSLRHMGLVVSSGLGPRSSWSASAEGLRLGGVKARAGAKKGGR